MISASLPGEALAQLGQLGQLGHLYPPQAPSGMTPEFLAPPPRPYSVRYAPRRPHRENIMPPPTTPSFPPVPGAYSPYLPHPASYAPYHLYRRPQAPYPIRRPTSGFVPPAPAPAAQSPPTSVAAPIPAPPPREEPPRSPERGAPAPYFCRGALIRLEDGSLRRVEEMRTEDFVMSADRSEHTLTQCTLLRLEERGDKLALTLTYDRNRNQVELESTVDHPFFVYGRGWASCKPDRTLARYGLRVQRLQVGDVCVSLVAKKHAAVPSSSAASSVHTAVSTPATTTVTSRTVRSPPSALPTSAPPQTHPENLSVKEDSRKRRWSASDAAEDAPPPLKKR